MKEDRTKTVWIFTGTLILLSFSLAVIYHFAGGKWNHPAAALVILLNSFLPILVVALTHKFLLNTPFSNSLGKVSFLNLWNLIAILAPLVFILASLVLLSFFPGVELNPNEPIFLKQFEIFFDPLIYDNIIIDVEKSGIPIFVVNLVSGILFGLTFNLVIGFTEEVAWRGFLFYQLHEKGFLLQALIQGAIWALWYAPFVWFSSVINPFYALLMNTLFFLLLSPLYLIMRYLSNSIVSVAILHGVISSYSYFADLVVSDQQAGLFSSYVQVNFFLLIVANVMVLIYVYTVNPEFNIEFEETREGFVRKTKSVKPFRKQID